MYGARPEQIQDREDWTNMTMAQQEVPFRVCLHANTTVSVRERMTVLECDYCPAVQVSALGVPDHLPAWLWQA